MNYIVSLEKEIDFAPNNEVAEILQNIRTILTTRIGSVPLHRDFGITWEHIDKPLPVAQTLMQAAIIDAIIEFEPRAKVVNVEFESNEKDAIEGVLKPRITISIGEDEEEEI